jgi:hypothetical protein
MWTRAELKENAKKYFKFNYWKMVLVALILTVIGGGSGTSYNYQRHYNAGSGGSASIQLQNMSNYLAAFAAVFSVLVIIGIILGIFVFAPLKIGAQRFFVVSHYQKAEMGEVGFAFTHSYMNVVKIMFLKGLYTYLWSLLLVIPGIVKAYEYRMIPYILAEHPDIDSREAFAVSKQMMTGNKWDAFVLDLSFIGWMILSGITFGIVGIFWVNPYYDMTCAELYVALKEITYGGNPQNGSGQWNNQQNMNGQWNNQQNMNGQWNSQQNMNGQWNNQQNMNGQWSGQQNMNNQWGNPQNGNGQWNNPQNGNDPWNGPQNMN